MLLAPVIASLGAPAAAQGDSATLRKFARKLQDPTLVGEARAELVDTLLDLGGPGALIVAKSTSIASHALSTQLQRDRKRVVRKFAKAAGRVVAQQGRGQDEEIREHQSIVAAAGRDPNLTKEKVQTVSDPSFAKLEELLTVTVGDVTAAEDGLDSALREIHDRIDALRDLQLDWDYAVEALNAERGSLAELSKLRPPVAGDVLAARLDAELDYAALLATPMSGSDRSVFQANAALRSKIDASAADGIRKLNRLRVLIGKNALRIDTKLCAAGADHSADMERLDFFAHKSPVKGKETPGQRAANFGTSGAAENIARGHDSGPGAITGWWYSPGHHRNMLGGHGRVGLGRSGTYWTQMFGG